MTLSVAFFGNWIATLGRGAGAAVGELVHYLKMRGFHRDHDVFSGRLQAQPQEGRQLHLWHGQQKQRPSARSTKSHRVSPTLRTNLRCPTIARPGTPSSFNLPSNGTDVLITITDDIYNYNEQPLQVHQERQAAAYQHQGAETAIFSQRKLRDCVSLVTINGTCQHGLRLPLLSQLWPIQHDPPAR